MPRDRGAEQGDVDGPLECSLALGMMAAEARMCVAVQQAARTFPWIGTHDPADAGRLQDEQHSRMQRIQSSRLGGPEKLIGADDPRCALQENGGLADHWYLDDGYIPCDPILELPYPQALDAANAKIGAERNQQKTEVFYIVADPNAAPPDWNINDVRPLASVSTAVHGNATRGVAVRPRLCVTDHLLVKADVIRGHA